MPRYLRAAIVAIVVALASLTTSIGIASAATVTPLQVNGNPPCDGGLKIEPVTSGTYGPITITVSGSSFGFTSTETVTSVIVKGGPNANFYNYGDGVTSDSGLNSPTNAKTGGPYGLSHLCFFSEKKGDPKA